MNTSIIHQLRAKAHHLKPVILLGSKGLTQAVVEETDNALKTHELIKVKLAGIERVSRKPTAEQLCKQLNAELIQLIGQTAVIYRKNKDD